MRTNHNGLGRRILARRGLAFGLALAMLCPPATGLMGAVWAQDSASGMAATKSILIFPFGKAEGASADTEAVAAKVDDAIKLRINTIGAYHATSYSRLLPSVQRSGPDGDAALTTDDLTPPFDNAKAVKIARQVGTDSYMLGTIESVTTDETTKKVTVVVTTSLHETQSGASIQTLGKTGEAVPNSSSDTTVNVTQGAINDVAGKVVAALNASAPKRAPMKVMASQRGRSKAGTSILFGILGTALLIAILSNSNGGGGGGGGGTTPTNNPPPPSSSGPPAPPSL